MSYVDPFADTPAPSVARLEDTQSNQAQFGLMQQQRALNALHGINVGDQASVQRGINALTGLGMLDQAKAVTDLAQTRGINTASLPLIQNALGMAGRQIQGADQNAPPQQQSSDQAPDLDAAHKQILQQGADAVNDLLSYDDPVLRAAAAATYRAKFAQMGIPQQNLDEVFGDLSDQGLKQHEAFLTAAANGQEAEHPTNYAASRSVFDANNPGGEQARATLQGHLANPIVQAALARAGLDISPGVNQAIAITGPARGAAAVAPYSPVTLEGPQGQPVQMSASNFAQGQAQPGAAPIVGATPGVKAAQTAAAGAPYSPVTVIGPGGAPTTESAAQFAQGRGAPESVGVPTGPMGAPPITGLGPAAQQTNIASGQELAADRTAAANSQPMAVALRKVYDLLPSTNIGPGTQVTNQWRSFAISQLPILTQFFPGLTAAKIQTADSNEVRKYMVQIAGAQAAQYGQGTNEKLAVAASGNPNPDMDNLSARDVTRMNIALQRAQLAKPALFDATHPPGHEDQYATWAANYGRTVDPRAFMLDIMTPTERHALMATITTSADKARFVEGVKAAEAAGVFHRNDIPR